MAAELQDRRTRKRLATRQGISDAATRLFIQRGFDHVTIDEIAAAADVGRMTVFNHFPRKEDMFFDREEEARDLFLAAVRDRDPDVAPVETLRRLAHRLVADDNAYIGFGEANRRFVETVAASEALKARARTIRDEAVSSLTEVLAESVSRPLDDPDAYLAASLLLTSWSVAFIQAHRDFRRAGDGVAARATFLAIIDQGSRGIVAAMAATPYA